MRKISGNLRKIIATNIRACRMKKFPGHGGGTRCAEIFGVSPQQWSPWETGRRTPDEVRLIQIAEFFEVTVEWMRSDHCPPPQVQQPLEPESSFPGFGAGMPRSDVGQAPSNMGNTRPPFGGIEGVDVPPPPSWEPAPPGSTASFFWLARHFIIEMRTHGLHVHLDKRSLEHLAYLINHIK